MYSSHIDIPRHLIVFTSIITVVIESLDKRNRLMEMYLIKAMPCMQRSLTNNRLRCLAPIPFSSAAKAPANALFFQTLCARLCTNVKLISIKIDVSVWRHFDRNDAVGVCFAEGVCEESNRFDIEPCIQI